MDSGDNQQSKPCIGVFYNENLKERDFCQLLYGIEEEDIPFKLTSAKNGDACQLSYEASMQSRLGVGLGISPEAYALHFEKLSREKPLFLLPADSNIEHIRALGANAARLVKRLPFKPLIAKQQNDHWKGG